MGKKINFGAGGGGVGKKIMAQTKGAILIKGGPEKLMARNGNTQAKAAAKGT